MLPILIHGDAAIAGQGIVSEVFNFSQLQGYRTGGTIHIVVNNQIGFTTGPKDARSSRYCTDVAKIVEAPIFHVNCNDPISVIHAVETAFDYRQTFGSDVVIDMYCWRKHGHNESDEPAFTQPVLYKKISSMPKISESLAEKLKETDELSNEEINNIHKAYLDRLELSFNKVNQASGTTKDPFSNQMLVSNRLILLIHSIQKFPKKYFIILLQSMLISQMDFVSIERLSASWNQK